MTRAATLCSRWLPLLVTLYTIARFALVAGELGRQGEGQALLIFQGK